MHKTIRSTIIAIGMFLFCLGGEVSPTGSVGMELRISQSVAQSYRYRAPRAYRYREPRVRQYRAPRVRQYRAPVVRRSNGGFNNFGGRVGKTIRRVGNGTTDVRKRYLGR